MKKRSYKKKMERIDYAAVKIYPYDLNAPMIITGLRHPEIYEYL